MNIIQEETVKKILNKILIEESSKVKRDEFNRVQYKIEEFENSLVESMKELRKLQDSIPSGLETITKHKISQIQNNLSNSQLHIKQLKEKIKKFKRSLYSQDIVEKKTNKP